MEDIKIGRNLATEVRGFEVAFSGVVAQRNPKRVAITFAMTSENGTEFYSIVPQSASSPLTIGIQLNIHNPTITLRIEDFGSIIKDAWVASPITLNERLTVFDATLEAANAAELR